MARPAGEYEITCPDPEIPDLSDSQLKALHAFKDAVVNTLKDAVVGGSVPEEVIIALLLFFGARINKALVAGGGREKERVANQLLSEARKNKDLNVKYKPAP